MVNIRVRLTSRVTSHILIPGTELLGYTGPDILLCSNIDSVILLPVLPFSDGLNLLKEVEASITFVLFVLERFTSDLQEVFELTSRLE